MARLGRPAPGPRGGSSKTIRESSVGASENRQVRSPVRSTRPRHLGGVFPLLAPVTDIDIPPSIALFVFLPTMVFEAAFNIDARDLHANIGPVLTLAVPAVMLATVITGTILWLAGSPVGFALSAPEAILIGAVLSSTDPVGVSELFRQIGAPKRLRMLVEGESLFNDATSIALSRLLKGCSASSRRSSDACARARRTSCA